MKKAPNIFYSCLLLRAVLRPKMYNMVFFRCYLPPLPPDVNIQVLGVVLDERFLAEAKILRTSIAFLGSSRDAIYRTNYEGEVHTEE